MGTKMSQSNTAKTLIFSVALNGYQWVYAKCLKSHEQYARKIGADYRAITTPFFSWAGVECCWLKLFLARQAMSAGYSAVVFLDADTQVQISAPSIFDEVKNAKHIYMARGYSGQVNSGVMLLRNHPKTRWFLTSVISTIRTGIAKRSNVGWGENGNVIEVLKHSDCFSLLDDAWNKTAELGEADYIRHYNHGPMRSFVLTHGWHKLVSRLSDYWYKLNMLVQRQNKSTLIKKFVEKDLARIQKRYPMFGQLNSNLPEIKPRIRATN